MNKRCKFNHQAFVDLRKNNLQMTQVELADELGCSVDTIKKWEGNKSHPAGQYVDAIYRLLIKIVPFNKFPKLFSNKD